MDKSATGRFIGIAKAALRRGHQVTHYTSTFRHTAKKHRFEENRMVEEAPHYTVKYIKSLGYTHNMRPRRFLAHHNFARNLIRFFQKEEKPDLIFLSMPPLSVGFEIARWAKKQNIPFIVDIIDPWPDSFIKDVPTSLKSVAKVGLIPFYYKLERQLDLSSGITAISKGYLDWALKFCREEKKGEVFYPAVNLEEIVKDLQQFQNGYMEGNTKIRCIYAGSLASSYDIPCILQAAELLEQKAPGKTEILIAGTGPQQAMVEDYSKKLTNVTYLGWLDKTSLMQQYKRSDLGLIQHMNSLTQTVTYKLFSYLSARLPVLNSLQSEMVQIIEQNQVGMNNKEGDYQKLTDNILSYIADEGKLEKHKQNALELTREKGDTRVVYDQLVRFLEEVRVGYPA